MGDSAEEFCLPLIAYSLHIGLKAIVNKCPITSSQAFLAGTTAAAVLWIKYSMCGFYLGWIASLIYVYCKQNWHSKILSTISYALIGLIALTIPIFAYFACHNAFDTMLNVYFFDNAKYYSGYTNLSGLLHTINTNIISTYQNNMFVWLSIIGGIIFLHAKRLSVYLLPSFIALVLFIFIRWAMPYYSFILYAFLPFGIVLLAGLFRIIKPWFSYLIITVISMIAIYKTVTGTYIFKSPDDLAQHQFDRIIQSESNPTLLNYGFLDGGFYTYSGLIPSNRFFCRLNIPIPEMMREQDSIIANQEVQFIVTREIPGSRKGNIKNEFIGYKKVAVAQQPLETSGSNAIYTLHKRITDETHRNKK